MHLSLRSKLLPAAAGLLLGFGLLYGQSPSGPPGTVILKKPEDPLRQCRRPEGLKQPAPEQVILPDMGTNPQEVEYRREIERLLKQEIKNVDGAIRDVAAKHKELIRVFPELKNYQEVVLEDNPGAWREGLFVNSKKVLSLHYNESGDVECIVFDSMTRGVDQTDTWIRKIMRLFYPNIQLVQLETLSHNLHMLESLENTSPEIQLKALRTIVGNLRTAIYSMDMMIASFNDRRNKRIDFQSNF